MVLGYVVRTEARRKSPICTGTGPPQQVCRETDPHLSRTKGHSGPDTQHIHGFSRCSMLKTDIGRYHWMKHQNRSRHSSRSGGVIDIGEHRWGWCLLETNSALVRIGRCQVFQAEYERSRIFDLRPKPKFSFKKIWPSAEGISRSRRYDFVF